MSGSDREQAREQAHDHVFGHDRPTAGERRMLWVVLITALTMAIEIAAGVLYGSMALLADGLHMASHTVALGIALFAYRFARQHAADPGFSFGTGKVNALAGYSGAVLLGVFAVGMAAESIERLVRPVAIAFDQALLVAILGLAVNALSLFCLGFGQEQAEPKEARANEPHGHDHNLRSAYLHVLADTLTSLLAIGALLSAKHLGQSWLDPAMGVVGAILVARWSIGLLRESGRVLLDRQARGPVLEAIRSAIEKEPSTRVADLHVWSLGSGYSAAIIAVKTGNPRSPQCYRAMLPGDLGLRHVTVEVQPAGSEPETAGF